MALLRDETRFGRLNVQQLFPALRYIFCCAGLQKDAAAIRARHLSDGWGSQLQIVRAELESGNRCPENRLGTKISHACDLKIQC